MTDPSHHQGPKIQVNIGRDFVAEVKEPKKGFGRAVWASLVAAIIFAVLLWTWNGFWLPETCEVLREKLGFEIHETQGIQEDLE